jgi:hypothetical protein
MKYTRTKMSRRTVITLIVAAVLAVIGLGLWAQAAEASRITHCQTLADAPQMQVQEWIASDCGALVQQRKVHL